MIKSTPLAQSLCISILAEARPADASRPGVDRQPSFGYRAKGAVRALGDHLVFVIAVVALGLVVLGL